MNKRKKHWLVLERERHEAERATSHRVLKRTENVLHQLSCKVGYLENELEARDARIKELEAQK